MVPITAYIIVVVDNIIEDNYSIGSYLSNFTFLQTLRALVCNVNLRGKSTRVNTTN